MKISNSFAAAYLDFDRKEDSESHSEAERVRERSSSAKTRVPSAASDPGTPRRSQDRSDAFQRVKGSLERRRNKIREDLKGWRNRLRSPDVLRQRGRGRPELVKVEPTVSLKVDGEESTGNFFGIQRVQYRAHLRMHHGGDAHTWSTDPFTLDELLNTVVRTRRELAMHHATSWCINRIDQKQVQSMLSSSSERFLALLSVSWCAAKTFAFWSSLLWASWLLTKLLRPWVQFFLDIFENVVDETYFPEPLNKIPFDLLLALGMSFSTLGMLTILLAGLAEISFLPAKAILKLEWKAETEKVKEQLELLLRSGDCMRSLDVCSFLSIGMATYFNSSETHKEGRCFCRRWESSEEFFSQRRRQKCSIFCMKCDCRLQVRPLKGEGGGQERWLVLRKDGIALFSSVMDDFPTDMLFFDTSFALFRDEEDHVLVRGASWVLELAFGDQGDRRQASAQDWCNAITVTAQLSTRTKHQRFGSFAPLRFPSASKEGDRHVLRRSLARYLINGKAICQTIAEAFLMAEHEIFVMSFFFSPHIELIRDGRALPAGLADWKVSSVLKHAADRGVRVYVVLFHETMLPNDSEFAEMELKHKNIFVVRHRSRFNSNLLWTHHEKVVVVDQQYAVIGGLDLCIGRYDDWRHCLSDCGDQIWHGQDYYNPRIKDVTEGRLMADLLDRQMHPRLPWQDIACGVLGRPARDLARHCVERWNHARSINSIYEQLPLAVLRRKVAVANDKIVALPTQATDKSWPQERGPWQECRSQVVRSVGRWSAGTKTENSSHQAYCDIIQDSKRFVYIENQFFCSGMEGDEDIGNRVIEALMRRTVRAHEKQEVFHAMIVLPLFPALEAEISPNSASQPIFRVMHAQFSTLRKLRARLQEQGIDETKYISIFGLRNHGKLDGLGVVTEQVYIHSKAMVVDDQVALIGSSNINDRSLLGVRDSEVNVVIEDVDGPQSSSSTKLGGMKGGAAANLRKALFAQHLGWSRQQLEEVYPDPSAEDSIAEMRRLAKNNTEIYEELFGVLPSNNVQTWADLAARRTQATSVVTRTGDFTKFPTDTEKLAEIRGYLVEFPLDFLGKEDLTPSIVQGFNPYLAALFC
mmetsp:Transcript_78500/g.138243  ORF Transcript_78500/g.138243 Transcript_78500/m.138243 type:complete len:1093 (-) Transcript_78500:49-3327(-)|eukprot:CAMPEP_0197623486 /NCGR_PEP_ID=MMETSP1338-20131121/3482_1 /TAXON_ID=43686 ORGANISM="Pelagodinium beii, Strain RCC1491" /NCGR_SAMPLE_ID=MMETSP1338 /ASSEMBLY_ACC=CAM_ASM_000754 /LENGTH=1092 /DNA_ID=CAMNT_0043193473 /DNA_START=41 /DNA_END=3319 /DNA_ORIENTATION=-